MNRRHFIKRSGMVTGALSLGAMASSNAQLSTSTKNSFNLKYAPHLGMFRHSAGDDPIDQLNFMADMGFTAFEDNEMRNRPIELQEKMAETMINRGLEMGVFVAHTIHWSEPNLASGNPDKREEFLAEIKSSVEVAKRVNAKWMTVVPGHLDLRLSMGYQMSNVVECLKQASEIWK